MSECNSIECADLTCYQRNRGVILNRVKNYYENDKERLKEQERDKYRNLSEEEKKSMHLLCRPLFPPNVLF